MAAEVGGEVDLARRGREGRRADLAADVEEEDVRCLVEAIRGEALRQRQVREAPRVDARAARLVVGVEVGGGLPPARRRRLVQALEGEHGVDVRHPLVVPGGPHRPVGVGELVGEDERRIEAAAGDADELAVVEVVDLKGAVDHGHDPLRVLDADQRLEDGYDPCQDLDLAVDRLARLVDQEEFDRTGSDRHLLVAVELPAHRLVIHISSAGAVEAGDEGEAALDEEGLVPGQAVLEPGLGLKERDQL